jgi:hypothetical protein
MRFLVTMNMPSRKGEMVHQIVCRYPVESIESFLDVINESDFILVEEFYRKPDNAGFFPVGMVIINTMHIGKVKVELSST